MYVKRVGSLLGEMGRVLSPYRLLLMTLCLCAIVLVLHTPAKATWICDATYAEDLSYLDGEMEVRCPNACPMVNGQHDPDCVAACGAMGAVAAAAPGLWWQKCDQPELDICPEARIDYFNCESQASVCDINNADCGAMLDLCRRDSHIDECQ